MLYIRVVGFGQTTMAEAANKPIVDIQLSDVYQKADGLGGDAVDKIVDVAEVLYAVAQRGA